MTLDDVFLPEEKGKITFICNFWDRLRHLVIDALFLLPINALVYFNFSKSIFTGAGYLFMIQLFILSSLYYFFFEFYSGRTFGKLMNKTKVIDNEGNRPKFKQVLLRTLIRFIPFQFLMIFLPYNRTLHDYVGKTWVVRIK